MLLNLKQSLIIFIQVLCTLYTIQYILLKSVKLNYVSISRNQRQDNIIGTVCQIEFLIYS